MNASHLKKHLALLPVLDALLDETHVSRAARRLGLTQSAVSHALKQLRDMFNDPLLIREQHGQMRLTPLATTLKSPIKALIADYEQLYCKHAEFDPIETDATFNIGLSDYMADLLGADLLIHLNKKAPKARFVIHAIDAKTCQHMLDHYQIDLCLGRFEEMGDGIYQQKIFSDHAVCIFKKTKASAGMTKKRFFTDEHVQVSYKQHVDDTLLSKWLKAQKLKINTRLVVAQTKTAIDIVGQSDLISVVFSRLAKRHGGRNIIETKPPVAIPSVDMYQYWHACNHQRPGQVWLRELVKDFCKTMS